MPYATSAVYALSAVTSVTGVDVGQREDMVMVEEQGYLHAHKRRRKRKRCRKPSHDSAEISTLEDPRGVLEPHHAP